MPLTLNVGLSRKIGEPNFGSRGATVNFAVELESSLVREPDQLREKIRYLFAQAKQAVKEELDGPVSADLHASNGYHVSQNGNGNCDGHRPNGRPATASQVRALHAIANRNRINLSSRLNELFGVSQPEDLSITDASSAIDRFKSNGQNEQGGRS